MSNSPISRAQTHGPAPGPRSPQGGAITKAGVTSDHVFSTAKPHGDGNSSDCVRSRRCASRGLTTQARAPFALSLPPPRPFPFLGCFSPFLLWEGGPQSTASRPEVEYVLADAAVPRPWPPRKVPDGEAAKLRPPGPTFGAPGGDGSGVPAFSHPAAGNVASKSRRSTSGASGAPSILDWPTTAGEVRGGLGGAGPGRGGAWWAELDGRGKVEAGLRRLRERVDHARASPHTDEGRSQVREGPMASLDGRSGLEDFSTYTSVSIFVAILLKLVLYCICPQLYLCVYIYLPMSMK